MNTLSSNEPIYNAEGTAFSIQDILPASWSLVVLLRHAECIECNLMLHELNSMAYHLQKWEVSLLCIGNGQASSIPRVRQRLAIDPRIPLYAHPSLELHQSLQLHSGILRSWGPKAIWSTIKALSQGHLQTSLAFPMSQQSGVVLLDEKHSIKWIHRSQFLGDIPNFGSILEQILLHRSLEQEE